MMNESPVPYELSDPDDLDDLERLDRLTEDPFVLPPELPDDSEFDPPEDDDPDPPTPVDVDPSLVDAVDALEVNFHEVAAAHVASKGRMDPVEFPIDGPWIARLGSGAGVGRWELVKGDDGEKWHVWEAVTTWVGWQERLISPRTITSEHRLSPPGTTTCDLRLTDGRGRSWAISNVPSGDAISPMIGDKYGVPLKLPSSTPARNAIANMLRSLGEDTREEVIEVGSTGWVMGLDPDDPRRPVFLAPNGSVTAQGIDTSYRVVPPPGSPGPLSGVQARMGFAGADLPPVDAAKVIPAFMDIMERPEPMVALLGMVFSAPLGLKTRPVVMLEGRTATGKTMLATATMMFMAAVSPEAKDAATAPFQGTSPAGLRSRLAWHRDVLAFIDDYRHDGDPHSKENTNADALMSLIAQLGYGSTLGAKSTISGADRGTPEHAATVLVTAEVAPAEPAIRNRVVVVHLDPADGLAEAGGAFDQFRFNAGAAPRSLVADYIRWLAERAEAHSDEPGGGLACMSQVADDAARRWYATRPGDRADEVVAALAAGWSLFRRYARARGIEEYLPSEALVEKSLVTLADAQAMGAAVVDPATLIVNAIRDAVESARGHLLSPAADAPYDAAACGWVTEVADGPNGSTSSTRPKGPALGILTNDRKWVIITPGHVASAARLAGINGLRPEQIARPLDARHVGSSQPRGRVPAVLHPRRIRGWVLPADEIIATDPDAGAEAKAPNEEDECF